MSNNISEKWEKWFFIGEKNKRDVIFPMKHVKQVFEVRFCYSVMLSCSYVNTFAKMMEKKTKEASDWWSIRKNSEMVFDNISNKGHNSIRDHDSDGTS